MNKRRRKDDNTPKLGFMLCSPPNEHTKPPLVLSCKDVSCRFHAIAMSPQSVADALVDHEVFHGLSKAYEVTMNA